MGQSYLYSYIFNNLLNDNLNEFSKSHPSPSYRISIMMSIMEEKGFELDWIKELYHIMCQRQLPSLNPGDALCPLCETMIASSSDIGEIKKDFCLSINISRDLSEVIKIEDYTPNKLNDCEKLVYNLENSIPISSSRKTDDKELKAVFERNKSARLNNEKIDVYALLEQFEDKPNSVSDIINAGWLHKVDNSYSEFIRLFFENNDDDNNTFDKKYDNYKKFLYKSNELLLKSLEISDMHSLLEYGRNLI